MNTISETKSNIRHSWFWPAQEPNGLRSSVTAVQNNVGKFFFKFFLITLAFAVL